MSALKPGSCLRSLVLTPQRVPSFIIPSCSSPLRFSPRLGRRSPDRTRLLSDAEDRAAPSPSGFLVRPPRVRTPRGAPPLDPHADTDLTTHAAMSLTHVAKVTTPYGFGAVLAESPCTRRRESLFHRNRPAAPGGDLQDQDQDLPTLTTARPTQDPWTPPGPGPGRSRVRAFGLQVMKELKRPAAALKEALSPARKGTRPL
ncbi:C2 calcium-dependent domain-containing protein 4B-like isoform X3 [Perca fluviatilis]|uniref:C2 calcium-dependent domain-containing protein 4B-like isoform X3 n=1 Tax=Perca fluviatilis TaxID=8168 RepID=UPI001964FECC|nr:C2 calcium-dependent domain-containing protein 4B-like isoform X3 [Perca fluviatilis]